MFIIFIHQFYDVLIDINTSEFPEKVKTLKHVFIPRDRRSQEVHDDM